jgi:uncharacterized protein YbcI
MTEELDQRDAAPAAGTNDGDGAHTTLAHVSRVMTTLYKDQFGRGPIKARSEWAGHDMLICTLEQSFTKAEQNLREMGEHQRLRDVRMFFQYATLKEFVEPVEQITGRKVRSLISGLDTEEDISAELFVFYPRDQEGPSRAEKSAL